MEAHFGRLFVMAIMRSFSILGSRIESLIYGGEHMHFATYDLIRTQSLIRCRALYSTYLMNRLKSTHLLISLNVRFLLKSYL